MASPASEKHAERLTRLEHRHDELIVKLDELNARIEGALAEVASPAEATSAPANRSC